jgi:hypothetical protein
VRLGERLEDPPGDPRRLEDVDRPPGPLPLVDEAAQRGPLASSMTTKWMSCSAS